MGDRYTPDNVPNEYSAQWLQNELAKVSASFQPSAGIWTPELWDDSLSGSEGQTYSAQNGFYRRIGDFVWVVGRMVMSSLGTLTTGQNARLGGLPFTAADLSVSLGALHVTYGASLSLGGAYSMSGLIINTLNYANLYRWSAATGVTAVTVAMITASGELRFNGWYIAQE